MCKTFLAPGNPRHCQVASEILIKKYYNLINILNDYPNQAARLMPKMNIVQSTLVISTSVISNNRLSRREKSDPCLNIEI